MSSDISSRIKSRRLELRLTQRQLADAVGVSNGAVSRWESGKSEPETERWPALAEVLLVSQSFLAGFTTEPAGAPGEAAAKGAALIGGLQLDWDIAFRASRLLTGCSEASGLSDAQLGNALKRIYTMGVKDPRMLRTDMASAIILSME